MRSSALLPCRLAVPCAIRCRCLLLHRSSGLYSIFASGEVLQHQPPALQSTLLQAKLDWRVLHNLLLPTLKVICAQVVLTSVQLGSFDGVQRSQLYLAILGRVFDVSRSKAMYGEALSWLTKAGLLEIPPLSLTSCR